VAQRLFQLAIIAGLIASAGCNRPPAAPDPGGSIGGSVVYATPPIRGLVREINGGPIGGASIRVTGIRSLLVESNDAGIFVIPPSTDLCGGNNTVRFEASKAGYWLYPPATTITCSSAVNPPEVTVEIKGQRPLHAVSGAPIEITLSNDDVNSLDEEGGYPCGPCKVVELGKLPLGQPAVILVDWSGPVPIHFWIEGWASWELVGLREVILSPGQTATTLTIPVEWRGFYLNLKVGLPNDGSRFPAGTPPVSVRIELKT